MSTAFKSFLFGLSVAQREAFAAEADSSRLYLQQVAYRNKEIELGLADAIVALAGRLGAQIALDDLPLTEKARHQRKVREGEVRTDQPIARDGSAAALSAGPRLEHPAPEEVIARRSHTCGELPDPRHDADPRDAADRRTTSGPEYLGTVGLGRTVGRREGDGEA